MGMYTLGDGGLADKTTIMQWDGELKCKLRKMIVYVEVPRHRELLVKDLLEDPPSIES